MRKSVILLKRPPFPAREGRFWLAFTDENRERLVLMNPGVPTQGVLRNAGWRCDYRCADHQGLRRA